MHTNAWTYQVIIDGPESVELKVALIFLHYICHLLVALVTHHMVNEIQFPWGPE